MIPVTYVVDNKLGGISSLNNNLTCCAGRTRFKQLVVHIDQAEWTYTRSNTRFSVDQELFLKFSAKDNLYSVIRRLNKLIPDGPGALILNDALEMQWLDHFHTKLTTYQLVHDAYNLGLAVSYPHVVDVFIAHSYFFYQELLRLLPGRSDSIFFCPHGVEIPDQGKVAGPSGAPLRLLFLGRMTEKKGIFLLPEIDRLLNEWGVPHEWTCLGSGPDLDQLKARWHSGSKTRYAAPADQETLCKIAAAQDVFVLPTFFEGSPVSLLETMSLGLVPVISDLPGGIREIVDDTIGSRIVPGDAIGFAGAIRKLHQDRVLLERQGMAARDKIKNEFNLRDTAKKYFELFGRYKEFYREKELKKMKIGSRLDRPWIPSIVTQRLRSI